MKKPSKDLLRSETGKKKRKACPGKKEEGMVEEAQ